MNFKATIEITPQQIADLMVTAFEGGISGWCKSAFPLSELPPLSQAEYEDRLPWYARPSVWAGDFRVEFSDAESNDKWILTRSKMETAFLSKLGGGISPADVALITANADHGDVADADDADRIVQLLLFGEVVFG